jgi:crotonobetainyl-CoA:carnitine CoA-transferase CaiB-like acyl-CoA transferase
MTATTIKDGISYLTNNKGKKTAVVFDLKNKAVKELMEDFMDTLDAMDSLSDPTPRKSLSEIKQSLLGK